MVTVDDDLAARTGLAVGDRVAGGARLPAGRRRPRPRSARPSTTSTAAFAAVGRLLQRHTGPIFPLIEDLFGVSIVEVHQEIAAVSLRHAELADASRSRRAPPRWRCSAPTRRPTARSRRSRSTPIPSSRFRHSMTMRRVKGRPHSEGRRAACGRRLPTRAVGAQTLADSLRDAATRRRTEWCWSTAIFGSTARRCTSRPRALAQALMARMPAGSVVSFMLPNWHEAAVIYLGATLAGMVVNPILPSLRDRELAFILVRCRQPGDLRAVDVRQARLRRDAGPGDRRDGLAAGGRGACAVTPASTPPYASLLELHRTPQQHCRCWTRTPCG